MLTAVALSTVALLALGYHFYGRFIAAQYAIDDHRQTPAVLINDGVDYLPTPRFYLVGQHFSAIAAAGPILACMLFGWLPCLLWIGIGVIFIGAVHDYSSLIASVRHQGQSVAELVRDTLYVSTRLGRHIIQELFDWRAQAGAAFATALTVLPPAITLSIADEGSYRLFWTLFGTSNQLLAALTLLAISVWLHRSGRRCWYTVVPMIFVMSITLWSLVLQAKTALSAVLTTGALGATAVNGVVSLALMGLALFLVVEAGRLMTRPAASSASSS